MENELIKPVEEVIAVEETTNEVTAETVAEVLGGEIAHATSAEAPQPEEVTS